MSPRPSRPAPAEREEMARLLPVPAERELPADRHRFLKDHLMHEVRQNTAAAAERRRRRRAWSVSVPLAAGALAAALAAGLLTGPHPDGESGPAVPGARAATASVLLDRIAGVAAARPAPAVRDDQYIYVAGKVAYSTVQDGDGRLRLEEAGMSHLWSSVDGSRPGRVRQRGKEMDVMTMEEVPGTGSGSRPAAPGAGPKVVNPTYRSMESLPTDPGVLLKLIYDETRGAGPDPDQEAFVTIGDLLRGQLAPPEVNATLYKAAALIPGVTVVDDAVDANGRHGVAVARTHAGERTEWIFERRTLEFLGERGVLVEDGPRGMSGQITATTAVLIRAVTDRPGQLPLHAG
ncbi:CU044_5270 family protein [Streptomyces sp. NPDC051567]|uniref:CU044_5270 family protein n=1 Tax=Streptomyces sp. NPDC051567 TaxID=3365660 RepID=UPI0037B3B9A2